MTNHNRSREHILNQLRNILNETLFEENVRVILFGSWARKEEKQSSDIDIAIEEMEQIPSFKWLEIMDRIEESTIPYHVDIVNLKNASSALIQNVKEEGIIWKEFKND
ncbi:nucleotidyltransferase domain-containing protein [Aquibacillus sp. 3ASR75-11]|uniref:Nucleotidyltransferase domain-containing protein n=1 Tax=Terrihalobacillus insolitus TaxID=2950438 RepID=A0A9X3WSH3_9BACI|nr:nucleotidyltransferase domain-containing protein [Terrihalobacillus insolitus]MDC3412306.1 nucleotidyltransferase domain-containing protein [Terrihalobacillus insolitus]MDC3423001.1 nucleotidyltransferase domain-containing protein [Terrihalobacillus insolitus]